MSFELFLNKIFSFFTYFINWTTQVLNNLMSNYIFKIIVYMSLIYFIINIIKNIIFIIFNKTNKTQKDKGN